MKRTSCAAMWLVFSLMVVALVLIPNVSAAQGKSEKSPKALVDLNTASEQELEELKGVGPTTAKKIIAGRPYKSVNDLAKAGVPTKTIDAIKPFVSLSPKLTPAAPGKESSTTGPVAGPSAKMSSKDAPGKGPVGLIDINTADQRTLESLPGVGPALAQEIIKSRPYKSVNDLSNVKGIGKAKMEALRDKITVGPSAGVGASAPGSTGPSPASVSSPKTTSPSPKSPSAKAAPTPITRVPGKKVNINTASKEELDALPEIGPVKAQAIIDGRPYMKPEDIMKVKGIKEGVYGKIKDLITVE